MKHTVDTNLLIQDSHIHIMIYAIVAALESLIIFGLGWPGRFRDLMIVLAFGFGALDFAGQWLMNFALPVSELSSDPTVSVSHRLLLAGRFFRSEILR